MEKGAAPDLRDALALLYEGQKLPARLVMQIHQLIYVQSNSTSELGAMHSQLKGAIQQAVQDKSVAILVSLKEEEMTEQVLALLWRKAKEADNLVKRVTSGRKWLIGSFPDLLTTATSTVRKILRSHASTRELLALHSHEGSTHTIRGTEGGEVEGVIDIDNCALCQILHERSDVAEVLASMFPSARQHETPVPLPHTRFTRTKNIIKPLLDPSSPTLALPSFFKHQQSTTTTNEHEGKEEEEEEEEDGRHRGAVTTKDLGLHKLGFLVENLLSHEECRWLIAESERIGYDSLAAEFLPSLRDNERALIMCPELADVMWARLEPLLTSDERIMQLVPFGFDSQGKWRPVRLNPLFRFCKYTAPAVGFAPHRDANFVGGPDERSTMTLMFYLNEGYEGGTTDFMHSTGETKGTGGGGVMDETIASELKRGYEVDYCLTPRTGMAVMFDHTCLHRGAPLAQGVKYIVRTDVVYRRCENPLQGRPLHVNDPNYRKMCDMYLEAAEWECLGRVDLSSDLYERALSIRQNVRTVTN